MSSWTWHASGTARLRFGRNVWISSHSCGTPFKRSGHSSRRSDSTCCHSFSQLPRFTSMGIRADCVRSSSTWSRMPRSTPNRAARSRSRSNSATTKRCCACATAASALPPRIWSEFSSRSRNHTSRWHTPPADWESGSPWCGESWNCTVVTSWSPAAVSAREASSSSRCRWRRQTRGTTRGQRTA